MEDIVYITGNPHKAEYFVEMMQLDIPYMNIEVDEIQSTSMQDIITHKAKQAFSQINKPVIIEDTKLSFNALGSLPGPFIKWFQQEIGEEGLCRLLDGYTDRSAIAGAVIAYYDGLILKIFEKELLGTIVTTAAGDSGFGWNKIFKPDGSSLTLGEMSDKEFMYWYGKIKPFDELRSFLQTKIDN